MSKIIGIDLGTTNCCGAYFNPFAGDKGEMIIFEDEQHHQLLPSNLSIKDDQIIVGYEAKNTLNQSAFVKRDIGNRKIIYNIKGLETPTPFGVSAEYLKAIRKRAEQKFGETITRAVVTVPAHFNHFQKEATLRAGTLANLHVEDLIPEPAAAALTYSWKHGIDNETMLVYDLGGGTFDATILSIKNKMCNIAGYGTGLAGDAHLGGYDFDRALTTRFINHLYNFRKIELTDEQKFVVLRKAEDIKIIICRENKGIFNPAEILGTGFGDVPSLVITIAEFGALIDHEIKRTISECRRTFEECKKGKPDLKLDRIIMVGGSSRIPFIKDKLQSEFGLEPILFEPDLCVAMGAAIYASRLGSIFESSKARIVLSSFPSTIDENLDIEGFVKFFEKEGEKIEAVSNSQITLQDEKNEYNQIAAIDEQGWFKFENVPIPVQQSTHFSIDLQSPDGEKPVGGTFVVSRGEQIEPEPPCISQTFKIKTVNGLIDLLPAGAPVGSTTTRKFFTAYQADEIRIPAYEGHYPLGGLVIKLKNAVPASVPIEVEVGYNRKNQIVLSAEGKEHGINRQDVDLELKELREQQQASDQFETLEEQYANIMKEIDEQLEFVPEDSRHVIKSDIDYHAAIIDRELHSQLSDQARILDSILKLEYIRTILFIPRVNVRNVEVMVGVLREYLTNVQTKKNTLKPAVLVEVERIKAQIGILEQKGRGACERNDIKEYNEVQQEFRVMLTQLQELQSEIELSPKFYERLLHESERNIRDSARHFEHMLKEKLPEITDHDAWRTIHKPFESGDMQKLFQDLKDVVAKFHLIKTKETTEQGKIGDLQILLVSKIIPLHKKLIHQIDQKGLLKIS